MSAPVIPRNGAQPTLIHSVMTRQDASDVTPFAKFVVRQLIACFPPMQGSPQRIRAAGPSRGRLRSASLVCLISLLAPNLVV